VGVVGAAIAAVVGVLGPRVTRLIEVAVLMRMTPFGMGHLRAAACAVVPIGLLLGWRWFFPGTLTHVLFLPLAVPLYLALYVATLQLGARKEFGELVATLRRRRAPRPGFPAKEDELPPPPLGDTTEEPFANGPLGD
jgi:hypothetical protein